MTARASVVSLGLALIPLIPLGAAAQAPARDLARSTPVGTATLSGTIVTDDTDPRPVRRVRVSIMTSDRQVGRTTVTDDAGRFSFTALPAGRYMVSATKQGYVTAAYGAKRPNRPGSALVLAEGQQLTDVTIRLTRGGVITGTIVDQNGEPFSSATVTANRYMGAGAQRTLVPAGSSQTDDRGQYRIWSLAPGDYTISANTGPVAAARDADVARLTDGDIKRALAEVSSGSTRPQSDTPPDPGTRPRTVGYASVFYPGTPVASQATPVKVGPAEERTGIDFALSLVPTAKVEGTIAVPDGINPQTLMVQMVGSNPQGLMLDLFRRSSVAADGSFSFAGLPPGPYTVIVRGMPAAPARGGSVPPAAGQRQPQLTHFARADVTVDGQDIAGLGLTLQAGFTVAGRVSFEGSTTPPDAARVRLNLMPVQSAGEVSIGQMQIQPDTTGAFSIVGVAPGRYRLMASIASPRPDAVGWQLKSATIGGSDAVDQPIDLSDGTDAAVVTFTDRTSELGGQVQDAAGQPAPEYNIVLFARDKSYWTPTSRRIRSVRPGADGKYTLPMLPPGEYLLTAVTDLEPGEQYDPAFLELLSRAAVPITIAEGEKKTQDLRLGAQLP